MSIRIDDSVTELDVKIQNHLQRPVPQAGQQICTETIKLHAHELKASLGIPDGPVFLSGHQPIFFHPGILAKDALLQALVRRHGGTALALILDTDQESIDFSWPGSEGRRQSLILSDVSRILAGQRLDGDRKMVFRQAIAQALLDISATLTPVAAQRARPYLFHILTELNKSDDLTAVTTSLRTFHSQRAGWQLRYIRASELVRSRAFSFFAAEVCQRPTEFRQIFNEALAEYRLNHDISNHAQPFPDLRESELPFWFSINGSRRPLTETDIQESGLSSGGTAAPAWIRLFENGQILPRAITLSLFMRLFVANLFVHGTGGGRYDRITEKVIERFFRCHAAPITVATATLHLEARADFALQSRSTPELHHEERRITFDPVSFLPDQCALHAERQILIELQHHIKGPGGHRALHSDHFPQPSHAQRTRDSFARRLPALLEHLARPSMNPPGLLHREFLSLKRRAAPYLKEHRRQLMQDKVREARCRENVRLFADRTFPFFFYDLSEFDSILKEYGRPFS